MTLTRFTQRTLLLLLVITLKVSLASGQHVHEETRESYVQYPASASGLLLEEVADVGSPLGLEVVTSLATSAPNRRSSDVWYLLKSIVHRLRNQNQIIHVNPHFYVSNGLDLGCRQLLFDEDTNTETEIETLPLPPKCEGACTNHGRYCVVERESFDENADNHRGAMLVEETLRRICFAEIYHGSDLKFWDYMEAYDRLECGIAEQIGECALRAVDVVKDVEYGPLDDCMHSAGGLDNDAVNVRLKQEIDKRSKGQIPFTMSDVPFIRMGRTKYSSGIYNVPYIFDFVCSIYQQEKGIKPIACDFCGSCTNARECLWELHCDGKEFDVSDFQDTTAIAIGGYGGYQIPPSAVAPLVVAPPPTLAPTATTDSPTAPYDGETQLPTNQPQVSEELTAVPADMPIEQSLDSSSPSTSNETVAEATPGEEETTFIQHPPTVISTSTNPSQGNLGAISWDANSNEDVNPNGLPALETSNYQDDDDISYDDEDDDYDPHNHHPFLIYGVPVLVATSLLLIYFISAHLHQWYHEQKISSAEEYMNDLMNESYRDNMAVSSRIDEDASDRSMEDPPSDNSPPFASFKVHMVLA